MYNDDDMLMLSGVQHYLFCPRQWALIHIDQQWEENALTIQGQILHKNTDNPAYRQKLNNHITLHSVNIASHVLGFYGISDAIELHPTDDMTNAITHPKFKGHFIPYPIEYKRGKQKPNQCDTIQLVSQVICLEEMYGISISKGALFYYEIRRREEIVVSDELRNLARFYADEMHRVFDRQVLPLAEFGPKCRNCSLKNICVPTLQEKNTVANYLKNSLYEEIT